MKTAKDILTDIHDSFLDRKVRQEFDEILAKEMPEEERKIEKNLDKAKADLDNLKQLESLGKVRIKTLKEAEAKYDAAEKAFVKARYKRIIELVTRLISEAK